MAFSGIISVHSVLGERRKLIIRDVAESVFETVWRGHFHGWPGAGQASFGLINCKEVIALHFLRSLHLPRPLRVCGPPVALKEVLLPSLSVINLMETPSLWKGTALINTDHDKQNIADDRRAMKSGMCDKSCSCSHRNHGGLFKKMVCGDPGKYLWDAFYLIILNIHQNNEQREGETPCFQLRCTMGSLQVLGVTCLLFTDIHSGLR